MVRVRPHPISLLGIEVDYSSHFPLRNIIRRKLRDFVGSVEYFTGKVERKTYRLDSLRDKSWPQY